MAATGSETSSIHSHSAVKQWAVHIAQEQWAVELLDYIAILLGSIGATLLGSSGSFNTLHKARVH